MAASSPLSALVDLLRAAGCVFAEDEAALLVAEAANVDELRAMAERRVAGEPLEHILGWAEFRGRRVAVDRGVFVPRRRTGFLVERAIGLTASGDVVVDLCCGSGALGAALAAAVGGVALLAADVDAAAVRCAARNVAAFGGKAYQGDLYDALPDDLRGRVGVLLANVPYVPTGELGLMPHEAREHEARVALDGGGDGLAVLRRVASAAPSWLAPGGHLLVEVSERQLSAATEVFAAAGLAARVARHEALGATVLIGEAPVGRTFPTRRMERGRSCGE